MSGPDFKNGRIAILGVGREGQAARTYLRELYPGIELVLLAENAPGNEFIEQLSEHDLLITGPFAGAELESFDILVRSPGISPYRKCIQRALDAGVQLTTPSNMWFAAHPEQKTICITGTKGKSTTSALLAHMLASCGYRVRLAGNIGLPLLACEVDDVDWWVIELSSYQLADLEAKPTVSVILNLSSEHLDWHGDERTYRKDKLRLASLAINGPLVANAADPILTAAFSSRRNSTWFNSATGIRAEAGSLFDGEDVIRAGFPEGLPGAHNLSNAAAALTVLKLIGADPGKGLSSMETFRSLPHRLQFIGVSGGVTIINDSISSTPLATAAALEAFSGKKVTLMVGGLDRGLDWTPYMHQIRANLPIAVIGIPDNGSRIIREMELAGLSPEQGLHVEPDLAKAVVLARKLTPAGGLMLLSPGAPSFPHFCDFRDRGRQFAKFCGFVIEEKELFSAGKK